MKNILIFFALFSPGLAMSQLPTISGSTLFKLQKENVTWLAPIDSLVSFIGGNGIYGGNGTLPTGGTTVTVPGQWQPLVLALDAGPGGAWTAYKAVTDYSSDDAYSHYFFGKAPLDSFSIASYDNGTTMKAHSGILTISGDEEIWITPTDSLYLSGVPQRTTAAHILAQSDNGYMRRIQGATSGQILKWNGSAWALAADDAGGVSDGDKGDITVTASGATWTIDANAVTTAKINDAAVTMAKINQASATSGQVIKWNGSAWAPADDATGGGEANTASNVGGGAGTLFVQKAGVNLEFKTITAAGGMNLSNASSVITLSTKAPQPPASENVLTSNFTATNLTLHQVDCSGGAISVTPPPLPSIGNRFAVVDARAASATNNITINFSGESQKLYGSVQNYIINLNGGYAEFIFMGSSTGWVATKG